MGKNQLGFRSRWGYNKKNNYSERMQVVYLCITLMLNCYYTDSFVVGSGFPADLTRSAVISHLPKLPFLTVYTTVSSA